MLCRHQDHHRDRVLRLLGLLLLLLEVQLQVQFCVRFRREHLLPAVQFCVRFRREHLLPAALLLRQVPFRQLRAPSMAAGRVLRTTNSQFTNNTHSFRA